MHVMAYHVPRAMRLIIYLKNYILSGIEKNNEDCRRIHLNKSNKWDAPADVLLVSKRIERLNRHQRTPRSYNKRNSEYWDCELNQRRTKKKCIQTIENHEDTGTSSEQVNVETYSPAELREELRKLGIKTKVRNLTLLQDVYKNALKSQETH